MLHIERLHACVDGCEILKGIDLTVQAGQVHAIMGPNGSGKSTLTNLIAGHPDYQITQGTMTFLGDDILPCSPEERAVKGIFLGFQYPVDIPGVNNAYFLRTAYNSLREQRGEEPIDAFDFMSMIRSKMTAIGIDEALLKRPVNVGFSGGEKKKNEILQMLLLEPTLSVLDETDSGLDIDALKIVASGINLLRNTERAVILVTHYQRLLHYVEPDVVHVLSGGKIIQSGDKTLALTLEEKGYQWLTEA